MLKTIQKSSALFIITLLSGCSLFNSTTPANPSTNNSGNTSQATVNIVDKSSENTSSKPAEISKTEEKIEKKTDSTTIDITYPLTGNEIADQDLRQSIEKEIQNFQSAAEDPLPADAPFQNSMIGTYERTRFSNQIVSIWLEFSLFAGGAHPNSTYLTKTYDLSTGKEMQLADLFIPSSDYLEEISQLSLMQLVDRSEYLQSLPTSERVESDSYRWIKEGTMPSPDNFKSWGLEGKNLNFYIPPYQVASYAEGPFKVQIPLTDLQDILVPKFK